MIQQETLKFGPILLANLKAIKDEIRKDKDWVWLNAGYERLGKSTLAFEICQFIDPDFKLSSITFTPIELKIAIDRAPKYSAVMVDEGVEALFTRRAMSKETIDIVKLFTQIGAKNLFVIINTPDPLMIEKYFTSHRAQSMTRVPTRGRYEFYSKKKILQLRKDPVTKQTIFPAPNFTEYYHKETSELWKAYLQKKDVYLKSSKSVRVIKQRVKLEQKMQNSFTLRDVAEMRGISVGTVEQYFHVKKLFPKKHIFRDPFGHWRVTKQGFDILEKNIARMHNKGH